MEELLDQLQSGEPPREEQLEQLRHLVTTLEPARDLFIKRGGILLLTANDPRKLTSQESIHSIACAIQKCIPLVENENQTRAAVQWIITSLSMASHSESKERIRLEAKTCDKILGICVSLLPQISKFVSGEQDNTIQVLLGVMQAFPFQASINERVCTILTKLCQGSGQPYTLDILDASLRTCSNHFQVATRRAATGLICVLLGEPLDTSLMDLAIKVFIQHQGRISTCTEVLRMIYQLSTFSATMSGPQHRELRIVNILDAMKRYPQSEDIQEQAVALLYRITSKNATLKLELIELDGLEPLLDVAQRFQENKHIRNWASILLASLKLLLDREDVLMVCEKLANFLPDVLAEFQQIRALFSNEDDLRTLRLEQQLSEIEATRIFCTLQTNCTVVSLICAGNNLGDTGTTLVAAMLKCNYTITQLNLAANNISSPGFISLAEALNENKVLSSLNVSHNSAMQDGIIELLKAFDASPSLQLLDLRNNSFSANVRQCAIQLHKVAQVSEPSNSGEVANVFMDELQILCYNVWYDKPHLTHLHLALGETLSLHALLDTDEGMELLAIALKHNTHITDLTIDYRQSLDKAFSKVCSTIALHQTITSFSVVQLADNWYERERDSEQAYPSALIPLLQESTTLKKLDLRDFRDFPPQLCQAITRNRSLTSLNLSCVTAPLNDIATAVCTASCQISHLGIGSAEVSDVNMKGMLDILHKCQFLTWLSVANVWITDVSALALGSYLAASGLPNLALPNAMMIKDGLRCLAETLYSNKTLKSLSLEHARSMGDNPAPLDNCVALSAMLRKNCALRSFNLSHCFISAKGVLNLSSALQENKTLDTLLIENAIVDIAAASALYTALSSKSAFTLRISPYLLYYTKSWSDQVYYYLAKLAVFYPSVILELEEGGAVERFRACIASLRCKLALCLASKSKNSSAWRAFSHPLFDRNLLREIFAYIRP